MPERSVKSVADKCGGASCRDVLGKSVVEKCWRRELQRRVGEECCREVLEKRVAEKGMVCGERSVVEEGVLEKSAHGVGRCRGWQRRWS